MQWLAETISTVAQQDGATMIDDRIPMAAACMFLFQSIPGLLFLLHNGNTMAQCVLVVDNCQFNILLCLVLVLGGEHLRLQKDMTI